MNPTIEKSDKILADIKVYQNKAPLRGGRIVFKYPLWESVSYVKRLIGLPGDVLENCLHKWTAFERELFEKS